MSSHKANMELWKSIPKDIRPGLRIEGVGFVFYVTSGHVPVRMELPDELVESVLCRIAEEWIKTKVDSFSIGWDIDDGYWIDSWKSSFDNIVRRYHEKAELLAAAIKVVRN